MPLNKHDESNFPIVLCVLCRRRLHLPAAKEENSTGFGNFSNSAAALVRGIDTLMRAAAAAVADGIQARLPLNNCPPFASHLPCYTTQYST